MVPETECWPVEVDAPLFSQLMRDGSGTSAMRVCLDDMLAATYRRLPLGSCTYRFAGRSGLWTLWDSLGAAGWPRVGHPGMADGSVSSIRLLPCFFLFSSSLGCVVLSFLAACRCFVALCFAASDVVPGVWTPLED